MSVALAILRGITPRSWLIIGVLAAVLTLYGAFKYQQHRADRAEADLAPARATVDALDKVATETPVIRQDQQEKQDEVETINGADERLPDGFGAELERVRRGGRDPHSR